MNENTFTWHIDKQLDNGFVDATISSSDGLTKASLKGVHGKMVDMIVSMLSNAYKWGYNDSNSERTDEVERLKAELESLLGSVADAKKKTGK